MIWRHLHWFHAGLEATRTYFYYSNRMIDFNSNLVVTTCEFCKNNFDFLEKGLCRTTSFIDATSDWRLALTTFMTLHRVAGRASPRCTAPCFEIYFGDVGGLLEHRDILQNSSETAMHPLVLFWLDPDHQAASKDACIVIAKFAIIFTDSDSSRASERATLVYG